MGNGHWRMWTGGVAGWPSHVLFYLLACAGALTGRPLGDVGWGWVLSKALLAGRRWG